MLYTFLGFPDGTLGGLRWHDKVVTGLPYRSVLALAQTLSITPAEVMDLLGTPDAPLGKRLSTQQSGAALRIALALHRLASALPDKTKAAAELTQPQAQLSGEVPLQLLRTAAGTHLVLEWIARLQRMKPLPTPEVESSVESAEQEAEREEEQ